MVEVLLLLNNPYDKLFATEQKCALKNALKMFFPNDPCNLRNELLNVSLIFRARVSRN